MEIALEKLPLNERVRLVQTLWNSIVADNPSAEEFPLTDAQKKLIDERLANMTMGVADKPKKKRQAGTAKGKAVFADDFKMTAEELVSQDDMETPMTKASTADKKEMLKQLLGCMQGVQIDDPKQAHHEHLMTFLYTSNFHEFYKCG